MISPLLLLLACLAQAPELRYVANAGLLVHIDGRAFLIDAPIREGIPPYATSPPAERNRLEMALPPYHTVEAILITHWHEDHFSAEAVAAHLAHNPRAVLISSPEVAARVRGVAADLAPDRIHSILPPPGGSEVVTVAGVPIHVLRIRHNPTRRLPEQHLGFLIGKSAPVLHVGDADPRADNFARLRALPAVDLALLPFWYVLDEASRRFVTGSIAPRRIAAIHLPPGDTAEVEAALRAAGVTVGLPQAPGSRLLAPGPRRRKPDA